MAVDASTAGAEARRDGPPVLSILASAALLVAAVAQLGTLASRFLMPSWPQWSGPYDIEFQPISGVLAVVVAVGAMLRSRTARTLVTAAGLGGFVAAAFWPPWAMLDTGHPVPAWVGLLILVLMGGSFAAGWREQRISAGRHLFWQIVAGGGVGWAIVNAILTLIFLGVILTNPITL